MLLAKEIEAIHSFGNLLTTLRASSGRKIKQRDVIDLLPGWTTSSYSRLENGDLAPRFDQLRPLYAAFQQAGISFSLEARQQFLDFARRRIAVQQTHKDIRTDAEWAQLRFDLARMDMPLTISNQPKVIRSSKPLLADVSHLVSRDEWREELLYNIIDRHKKLVVVRGPAGIGKTSELNWLAVQLIHQKSSPYQVILCDFRSEGHRSSPEEVLDVLIGTILTELGCPLPQSRQSSFEENTSVLLDMLEKTPRPLLVLADHCEYLLQEHGIFAPIWEHFLSSFLRSRHTTTLFIATQQWPGWFGGEHVFVSETLLPPLSMEKSILLLQQLGLDRVSPSQLADVYRAVGGIPLCLEWIAALVKQPLYADDWEEFGDTEGAPTFFASDTAYITQGIQRLLQEPRIFGGNLAQEIAPVLKRIVTKQRLSPEALRLLDVLSIATIPLARSALQVICPSGPRPIKELRRASLLVAYPDRVQLLPMVAAAVIRPLTEPQLHHQEELLLKAYQAWLQEGTFQEREQGTLIAEISQLLLRHQRLLEAVELLIRYGWLSFNLGFGPRIARLSTEVVKRIDTPSSEEEGYALVLLHYFLAQFLDRTVDAQKRVEDYTRIIDAVFSGRIMMQAHTQVHVMHHLLVQETNHLHFTEARELLDACSSRLQNEQGADLDVQVSLLEERAFLFSRWSGYAEEQHDAQQTEMMREQTVSLYRQCINLLVARGEQSPLQESLLKKRLARALNNLGYQLNRLGFFEEALHVLNESIALKEAGYVHFGALAASYGEKAQSLAGLGRFQEALQFDERAMQEVQHLADAGHASSREEIPIYQVNRGRLYLLLGKVDEAEQLIREALPRIHSRRRMYHVFAREALEEIRQWRDASPTYQLDWRWIERYRQLTSFDAFWWLAHAGPFTDEERRQWEQLLSHEEDQEAKKSLEVLIIQSRQRELSAAIEEQREPQLWYPAIPADEVVSRIDALHQLDQEIHQGEPNALVRWLYQEKIAEDVCFLQLIKAAHDRDSLLFKEMNQRLHPTPTQEEMEETLASVQRILRQGLEQPQTVEVAQSLIAFMREYLHVDVDLSTGERESVLVQSTSAPSRSQQQSISAAAAVRFFNALLTENGYEGWQVLLDRNAHGPRVEAGLRHLFLPDTPLTLNQVKTFLSHELSDHIGSAIAGERSQLGLLGIGTAGYLETGEGLALYHERQVAQQQGTVFEDSRTWIGTLATGLACGSVTPPQTFLFLYRFFASFFLLQRLLKKPDEESELAQEDASKRALARCLRTYRGVPDLQYEGVCYSKDALYLRGLWKVERALAQDEALLRFLTVGKVALEHVPMLQELGISASPLSLRRLLDDPHLDEYILSFQEGGGKE